MAKYLVKIGIEREGVRYEPGDVVTSDDLRGWGIRNFLAIDAIEQVDEDTVDTFDVAVTLDDEEE